MKTSGFIVFNEPLEHFEAVRSLKVSCSVLFQTNLCLQSFLLSKIMFLLKINLRNSLGSTIWLIKRNL